MKKRPYEPPEVKRNDYPVGWAAVFTVSPEEEEQWGPLE